MGKSSAHVRYKTKDGRPVPGVSTITGQLDKPALVKWANNLGLHGIDSSKFRDDKADIGTLGHAMILGHFKNEPVDTGDYSKNQIDQAENSLLSFYSWEKQHDVKPLLVEEPIVSDLFLYGGTLDFFGTVDNVPELLDFKTGSGIYREMWYKVAGYLGLLRSLDHQPMRVRILNIPRTEDESFKEEVKGADEVQRYLNGFLKLLEFYYIDKEIGR